MGDQKGRQPPDLKRILRITRWVIVALALVGGGYIYARFSLVKLAPQVVKWPYANATMIIDEWPSWGRDIEQGDLVWYRFPGEPELRPVMVAGLPGQTVQMGETTGAGTQPRLTLQIGKERYPHRPGILQRLREVPAGHLILLNHKESEERWTDSRTKGPLPIDGVERRMMVHWGQSEPPQQKE